MPRPNRLPTLLAGTLVMLLAAASTLVVAPGARAASTSLATAYQLDAAHDGYQTASLATPLTAVWSVTLSGAVSYPLIVNGTVYVTARNAGTGTNLYAISQATGTTLWSHQLGGSYYWSALAYDAGQIFTINNSGLQTAFAVRTASRRGGTKPRGRARMHIAQSNLTLSATSTSVAYSRQSETLRIESRLSPRAASAPPKDDKADRADISRAAHEHGDHAGMLSRLGPALYALALLVEQLTGQKINLLDPSEVDPQASGNTDAPAPQAASAPSPPQPQVAVELDAQSIRDEAQTSTFSANGTVTTTDGRQITFGLQATISREFLAADSLSIRSDAAAKDPLVLDLGGAPTQLSPQRIAFDVNADGVVDHDPVTNEELGTLQSTGVFLREDGSAGTVRQIDVSA
jgi:hypothetical protein